jgi:hypothetical protein
MGNYGAKDYLKLRLRVRRAYIPSVLEVIHCGFQGSEVPVSSVKVRVPKQEERREVDR